MKNSLILIGNLTLVTFMAVVITTSYHAQHPTIKIVTHTKIVTKIVKVPQIKVIYKQRIRKIDYWATVHKIESSSGKRLIRIKDKKRGVTSCKWTTTPCGHFQLSSDALIDIGCVARSCKSDRSIYSKALAQAKAYDNVLKQRYGCNLGDYQYLCHQQGATGAKNTLLASKGKKKLHNKAFKNLASNMPYSYWTLKKWGSKKASNKFLIHWKTKWDKEAIYYTNTVKI